MLIRRKGAACALLAAVILGATPLSAQTVGTVSEHGPVDPVLAQAWSRYYSTIDELRLQIESSPQYKDVPEQRAKAYHVLMETQAMAYNFAIAPQLEYPRIYHNTGWQTQIYTMGGIGADFDYRVTFLDGSQTYRLTGDARDSKMLLAQLTQSLPSEMGTKILRTPTNFDFSDFKLNDDGSFEVILSAERHAGNWVQLDRSAPYQWILFRPTAETFGAVPAELHIERISPIEPGEQVAREFSPAIMAQRIDRAADFARYIVKQFVINWYGNALSSGMNKFKMASKHDAGEVASPSAQYGMAAYEVNDDEALIITLPEVPKGAFWSMQTYDVWFRSIYMNNRQTSINGTQVSVDPDGKVRFVLSKRDPGIANWLDTCDFAKGQLLFRNYRSPTLATAPTIQRVKFADVSRYLPPETKRVDSAQRLHALEMRRQYFLQRHGE